MRRRSGGGARVRSLSVVALIALLAGPAAGSDARVDTQIRRLKTLEQQMLMAGERAEIDAIRSRGRKRLRASLARSRAPRDDAFGPQGRAATPLRLASPRAAGATPPVNLRLNTSPDFTTQSETSIAGIGSRLVAAWNDGGPANGGFKGIGCAHSVDGGGTWTDDGALPLGGGVAVWVSDPVVVADAPRSRFYVTALVITDAARNGLALVEGAFDGASFSWKTPRLIRATRDTLPDKPWMAADTLDGGLYVSYTSFFRKQGHPSDDIEFQHSADGGQTWPPAAKLSLDDEDGLVQGSRPAVGPEGEVHVVWKTIDTTLAAGGLDAIRIRSSRDHGATFGTRGTAATLFTNFCSGPPGFNRGSGLGFPSIAIDRGSGPHRGRIYLAWEESLDFYDDPVSTAEDVPEAEPNDSHARATPITLGQTVHARIAPAQDVDWFRFQGAAGQTALVILDSLDSSLNVSLRLWCGDGATRLALSDPLNVRERAVLFTLPKTGDYFVTVAPYNDSTGSYRLATGLAFRGSERGRDQRDVFVAHSDDGVSWSVPVRASDSPAGYDDWLPELAVAGDGKPYLAWYDWRQGDPAGCGAASTPFLARSDDGGDSWVSLGAVADEATVWSAVNSNLVPNMGDYISLWADEGGVFPCWADGRGGDPDVYLAMVPLPATAHAIVAEGGQVVDGAVQVRWGTPPGPPLLATAYRKVSGGDWTSLGEIESEGGTFAVVDADVQPGFRYLYRLGLATGDGEVPTVEQAVDVPDVAAPALAIERLLPNPSAGSLHVWFRRPDLGPAKLEVMDLMGRRVFARELGYEYGIRGVVDLSNAGLDPGLYQVCLIQGGRIATAKAVVLR